MVSLVLSSASRARTLRMAVLLAAAGMPVAAQARCGDLLPRMFSSPAAPRGVHPDDILRLREIGQPEGSSFRQPSPLSVSPDGRLVAFVLSRADPDANAYCRALVVVALDGRSPPRLLADAGELPINQTPTRGSMITVGYVTPTPTRWSPDGRWIAFQRSERGSRRLWRVAAAGGAALALSPEEQDVETFDFAANGPLIFATRPSLVDATHAIDREALSGWLYDARVAPNFGPRPLLPANLPLVRSAVDVATGQPAALPEDTHGGAGEGTALLAEANGQRAWVEPGDARPMGPTRLVVEVGGVPRPCTARGCGDGIYGLWWDEAGREMRFLRRDGWAQERTTLYRWRPGTAAAKPVLATTDVLTGCVSAGDDLVCLRENATTPRQLVRIDVASGRSVRVFDPNPEFGILQLGKVERLRWRNASGREAWGDLVLPPGYTAGDRLPMVVVGYHSDGFLRGGTGNEFPIFAFAAQGFAVLSTERPSFVAQGIPGIRTWDEFNAANLRNWAEQRSLVSSLAAGIEMAVASGVVDRSRVGITGLSDGASTARFALINSTLFAAASISSCCVDAQTSMIYAGIAYADQSRGWGYPPATRPDPEYWRDYSLALNADKVATPMLMQLADAEYILGLESFATLRERGQPVELFVFPGEYHMKSQPAHRRAIFARNLDWFAFWLQGREDPDPAKAAQYRRWKALRDSRSARR